MSISLVLLIFIAGAIAFYGVKQLNLYADDVSEKVYTASNAEMKLDTVRILARQMDEQPEVIARAQKIVAESQSYQYQNTIIRDLQAMAARAGVSIVNYNFVESSAAASSSAPAASGSTATPSSGVAAPQPAATTGPKSVSFNITLADPVNYSGFLNFVHYVEQNATKMQISSIGLSKSDKNDTQVTVDTLTIEVYVR